MEGKQIVKIQRINQPSRVEINQIVDKSVAKASAIAALPLPFIDIAGVVFVQVDMSNKLFEKYGRNKPSSQKLLLGSLLTSLIGKLISEALGRLSVQTNLDKMLSESLIKASIASLVTKMTGDVCIRLLDRGSNIDEISIYDYIEYFKEQMSSDQFKMSNLSNLVFDTVLK